MKNITKANLLKENLFQNLQANNLSSPLINHFAYCDLQNIDYSDPLTRKVLFVIDNTFDKTVDKDKYLTTNDNEN